MDLSVQTLALDPNVRIVLQITANLSVKMAAVLTKLTTFAGGIAVSKLIQVNRLVTTKRRICSLLNRNELSLDYRTVTYLPAD